MQHSKLAPAWSGWGQNRSLSLLAAVRGALSKLGWTEGSNLRIELRWGNGDAERIKTFAKALVVLQPDVILTYGTANTAAVQRESRSMPIVFVIVSDPIGSGFAANLSHPGGNITGFTDNDSAMGGKWVELLKEIAPRTSRVALLINPPTSPPLEFHMPSIQAAALQVGVRVIATKVYAKDEIEAVIAAQARDPGGSLILMPNGFNAVNQEFIFALAAHYRVPAIHCNPIYAGSSGLMTYGSDFVEAYRLAAGYIDRILKGAKPGELPIQLPTKFQLIINLKTAKALGLDVPPTLLARADEVIE